MKWFFASVMVVSWLSSVASAQDVPADYQQVLSTLGKQGDYKANVLKVNIPRNDLSVTVANVKTPTPFGFGGWMAMTKGTGGMDVMMGDLVLTEDEVNPVMSALLDNGLDVTALHNHFFWEQPRIFYMHVHGHGSAGGSGAQGEAGARSDWQSDATRAPQRHAAPAPRIAPARSTRRSSRRSSAPRASRLAPVYKITIGRDDLKLTEMGAPINARMGLNTWAAFVGTDENAADRRRRGDAGQRGHAGLEGASRERARRRRDSPPHDRHAADRLLPALLGNRTGGQTGERLQGRGQRTRQAQ